MDYKEAFGRAVKSYRSERGITQEDCVADAGMVRQNLSKIERGVGDPTLTTIMKLSAALDVTAPELLQRAIDIFEKES